MSAETKNDVSELNIGVWIYFPAPQKQQRVKTWPEEIYAELWQPGGEAIQGKDVLDWWHSTSPG